MNVEESHLSADETRVTVGGLLRLPPAEINGYAILAIPATGTPPSRSATAPA